MFPSDWDHSALPEIGYELVEVSRDDSKYREIENLFQQTMKDYSIRRLQRTWSLTLWQHFQLFVSALLHSPCGSGAIQIMAGGPSRPLSVCLLLRFSFTHGFFWSLGRYFARDASYSHQCCPSIIDHHSVFVAQVVVGDSVWGNQVYLLLPTRPGISNRLLDSCVDNRKNPSIFVIFEKHQIYSAYILEYT
ncbi:Poly [ADP-ribose] polymerase 12, partial [Nipponia nippon]